MVGAEALEALSCERHDAAPIASWQERAGRHEARAAARGELVHAHEHHLIAILQRPGERHRGHHGQTPRVASIHGTRVIEDDQVLAERLRRCGTGNEGEEEDGEEEAAHAGGRYRESRLVENPQGIRGRRFDVNEASR